VNQWSTEASSAWIRAATKEIEVEEFFFSPFNTRPE
jgi:hypothetical protein